MVDFVEGGLVGRGMPVERVGVGFEGKEASAQVGDAVAVERFEPGQIIAAEELPDCVVRAPAFCASVKVGTVTDRDSPW